MPAFENILKNELRRAEGTSKPEAWGIYLVALALAFVGETLSEGLHAIARAIAYHN